MWRSQGGLCWFRCSVAAQGCQRESLRWRGWQGVSSLRTASLGDADFSSLKAVAALYGQAVVGRHF